MILVFLDSMQPGFSHRERFDLGRGYNALKHLYKPLFLVVWYVYVHFQCFHLVPSLLLEKTLKLDYKDYVIQAPFICSS